METLQSLQAKTIGITKKEIAIQMDKKIQQFNFSAESGLTSYKNYSRNELLEICLKFNLTPKSNYILKREAK